jgi:hypothetical protein
MTGADKVGSRAAALLVLFVLTAAPARAQVAGFGGSGGGEDMMTQMAPMLQMMKAKMGKRRFGMLMQTVGPVMSRMMENGGFGGFGGALPGGFNGIVPGGTGYPPENPGFGGGDGAGRLGGSGGADMMAMIPQLMRLAELGGTGRRRHHWRHD